MIFKKRYPAKIAPPVYERVFIRKRLFDLVRHKNVVKVIWVNGAAGYGKTVFVASYLRELQEPFLWYKADNGENTIEDLFYFLTLALQKNYPNEKFKLPVLNMDFVNNLESFTRIFFRQFFSLLVRESAIVIDNCQEIENDAFFLKMLKIAVDELPLGLQLICISRNQPDPALKHLSVYHELLEINEAELKFNQQESQDFLKWLNPQLSDDHINAIYSKTIGWAAGMVLMSEHYRLTGFDSSNTNKNTFDYLAAELLSNIPEDKHIFLVSTALFTRFTIDMAVQLTQYKHAKVFLNELVAGNKFVEHSEGSNPSYSYHPLLRDLLLNQSKILFGLAEWQELKRKAAGILVKQDKFIEAMSFYKELKDWQSLKGLVLKHVELLIDTGRNHTAIHWIEALPDEFFDTDAWLNYWYGVALKSTDPLSAEMHLDKSYQQFVLNRDAEGIYLSWQAAVESIILSWHDFSKLGMWISRFDELRETNPGRTSIDIKAQFYATAIQALSVYDPQRTWLKNLLKISEHLIHIIPIKKIKLALAVQLGTYYLFTCQLAKTKTISHFLEIALDEKKIPPLLRITSAFFLGLQKLYAADAKSALNFFYQGLDLSESSGVSLFSSHFKIHIIGCHICHGDINSAYNALQEAKETINMQQQITLAMTFSFTAWLELLSGNRKYALEQNEHGLKLTEITSVEPGYVCSLSLKVQIMTDLSQWKEAEQTLLLLYRKTKNTGNNFNLIQYYVSSTWFFLSKKDEDKAIDAIKKLLHILQTEQILTFFGWRPEVLRSICFVAIENGIEEEFSKQLLTLHRLSVPPPLHLEKWPWSVKIFSFGSLIIEVDGKPIEQPRKSQKKILELLATLIALGGRNVDCNQLAEILWPDAEADLARKALETSLHRLRKLIGSDSVLLNAGMISLNGDNCWLDLWLIENTTDELKRLLQNGGMPQIIIKLTDRLLRLHNTTFLKHFDLYPIILKQGQLLNEFCRTLNLVVDFHRRRGEHDRVCMLLEKELELRPYEETGYQKLMNHYINQGQLGLALHIYNKCRQVLFENLKIPLSDEIKSLAKQIKSTDGEFDAKNQFYNKSKS